MSPPLPLPLAVPAPQSEGSQAHKEGGDFDPLPVFLRSDQEHGVTQILGELLLKFHRQLRTLVATIKPGHILHNSTSTELAVWPCLQRDARRHELKASCLQTIPPGQSSELIFWQNPSVSGAERTMAFRSSGDEDADTEACWSVSLSPNFVRRSFSLPTLTPALLTMHEVDSQTYLVVSHDHTPRLQFQNLCATAIEVVESASTGIHAMPELMPPGQLVAYEPPTISRLYPLVYDEELSSHHDKELLKSGRQVSVRLRLHGDIEQGEYEWSHPFPLSQNEDRVVAVPGMGSVLVTGLTRGASTILTLLPTGRSSPSHPSPMADSQPTHTHRDVRVEASISQLVVCVDTEASDSRTVSELLRVLADNIQVSYLSYERKGTQVKFTVHSLRIDNMLEKSLSEYAVMLLPRAEHARRASLIESETPPLINVSLQYSPHSPNTIDEMYVAVQPVTLQLEDSLLHSLRAVLGSYGLPGVLQRREAGEKDSPLPEVVRLEAERDTTPLVISSLVIEPTALYLNARISLKVLLSCSDSPFRFPRYQLDNVYSNWTEVSQTIAARYVTTVVMHIGWLLGSLELIGSPASFLQSVGRGLRDLVTLPYEGLTRSPALFILGIGQGTTAFLRHFSGGALRSMTNLASSLSQNMERLSMDPEHVSYQDQQRRDRPVTHFTTGIATGVSSFGLSLMSAVAGIVDQPMQSFHRLEESSGWLGATRGVLAGVGKGLVGVLTKPVGGAMELVSQTGQGIMHGTGLVQRITHKTVVLQKFVGPVERTALPPTTFRCAM